MSYIMNIRSFFKALATPWKIYVENTIYPGYLSPPSAVMTELKKQGYKFEIIPPVSCASIVLFSVIDPEGIEVRFSGAPNWEQRLEKYKQDFDAVLKTLEENKIAATPKRKGDGHYFDFIPPHG